jgi:hypothetical protein
MVATVLIITGALALSLLAGALAGHRPVDTEDGLNALRR